VQEKFNMEITTTDLECLQPLVWLNDEVINFYIKMMSERNQTSVSQPNCSIPKCHFYNSFFCVKLLQDGYRYKNVKRWSKRAKITTMEMDKIIIPTHVHGNHWCLSVINIRDKQFEYYDSLGGSGRAYLKLLRNYIVDEAKNYSSIDLDLTDWRDIEMDDIPQQLNGCDCGVFTLKFADYVSEDQPLTFKQEHMPYFRRRIALDIYRGELQ
jgi:sentrin-specific protease 1